MRRSTYSTILPLARKSLSPFFALCDPTSVPHRCLQASIYLVLILRTPCTYRGLLRESIPTVFALLQKLMPVSLCIEFGMPFFCPPGASPILRACLRGGNEYFT